MELEARHLIVLQGLSEQGKISRSQMTVGPLRHVLQKERERILNDLQRAGLIDVLVAPKPTRGKPAYFYRITDAGREVIKQHPASSDRGAFHSAA